MANNRKATGAAKDADPKVEKAKQGIQKNAEKLSQKTNAPKPATGTNSPSGNKA